jgi:hypothetical protein
MWLFCLITGLTPAVEAWVGTFVSKAQPDADTAHALRSFLRWAISATGGNSPKYPSPVGFIPLPDFIRELSQAQIAQIKPVLSQ